MSTPNATAILAPTPAPLPATVHRAVRLGLPIALLSAGALSFQGLFALARAVGWEPHIAWLLPVSIDVAATIATVVWLGSPAGHSTAPQPRRADRADRDRPVGGGQRRRPSHPCGCPCGEPGRDRGRHLDPAGRGRFPGAPGHVPARPGAGGGPHGTPARACPATGHVCTAPYDRRCRGHRDRDAGGREARGPRSGQAHQHPGGRPAGVHALVCAPHLAFGPCSAAPPPATASTPRRLDRNRNEHELTLVGTSRENFRSRLYTGRNLSYILI